MFLCRNAGHVNRYSLSPNHPATEAAPGQESKGRPLYYLSACRRLIRRVRTRNLTPNSNLPIPRRTCCRFLARCHAESGFCNSRAQPMDSKTPKSCRFWMVHPQPHRQRHGGYATWEITKRQWRFPSEIFWGPYRQSRQKKFILFMILRPLLCHVTRCTCQNP